MAGGHAVSYYAEPRFTKDFDFVFGVLDSDLEKFGSAMAEFGFPLNEENLASLSNPKTMFSIGVPPNRFDFMNSIAGVEFEEAYSRSTEVEFGSIMLPMISLADLKKNKEASGRPQDLIDLELLNNLES